jgi:hypothetical protein
MVNERKRANEIKLQSGATSLFDVYLSKQLRSIGLRPDWSVESPKLSENYQSGEEQLCPN